SALYHLGLALTSEDRTFVPAIVDNGTWDLACASFPNDNVVLPLGYRRWGRRYGLSALCLKGKRAFFNINHSRMPCPYIPGFINAIPSFITEASLSVMIYPYFQDSWTIEEMERLLERPNVPKIVVDNIRKFLSKAVHFAKILNIMGLFFQGEAILFVDIDKENADVMINYGACSYYTVFNAAMLQYHHLTPLAEKVGITEIKSEPVVGYDPQGIFYYPVKQSSDPKRDLDTLLSDIPELGGFDED